MSIFVVDIKQLSLIYMSNCITEVKSTSLILVYEYSPFSLTQTWINWYKYEYKQIHYDQPNEYAQWDYF